MRGTLSYGDNVEARLVAVARSLFAERGYAKTSLTAITEAAQCTKGAIYYYFNDKQGLFRAVYLAEQQRLITAVGMASRAEEDPWDAMHTGIQAFIHELCDKRVQRIVLIDAPATLGWESLRATAFQPGLRLIRENLDRAADAGLLAADRVELLANLIYGVVREAVHYIGDSEQPHQMIEPVLAELHWILDRLCEPR